MSLNYALIAHANAFLFAGEPMPGWSDLPGTSNISEYDMGLFWNRSVTFATPQAWAEWLQVRQVTKVQLFLESDRQPLSGGKFGILTEGVSHRMLWSPALESSDGQRGPASRYVCRGEDFDPRERGMDEAESEFRRAFHELVAFLEMKGIGEWADHFRRGLTLLEQEYSPTPEVEEVFPRVGYEDRARRLYQVMSASSGMSDRMDFWDEVHLDSPQDFSLACEHARWMCILAALSSYP